jgi:hypothetical protein
MEDLRSEIRWAFEREQAAFPPPSDLRPRFVTAAAAQPRARLGLQWVAAVAALLIAALVVAALVSSRVGLRTPTPGATPSAPRGDYGPPPAGVPLIYVTDPAHDGWYIGFDWTGTPRGTVKLADPPPTGVLMAPDGQGFAYGIYAKGGEWEFLDRLGNSTGSDNLPGAYSTMWADDNRHVCAMTMDPNTLAYTLWTATPGEDVHSVGEIARDPSIGQTTVGVIGCSIRNDRAIALRTTVSWPSEVWVVRLSDGHVLTHHTYEPGLLATVVSSADARYLGETSVQATSESQSAARYSHIRKVSDWSVVASMDPVSILAFSGDNSSVLTQYGTNIGDQPSRVSIKRWSDTGAVDTVWTYTGSEQLWGWTAQPAADGFALGFLPPVTDATASPGCPPGMSPCDRLQAIFIVHGDGSSVQLPDRYNRTW